MRGASPRHGDGFADTPLRVPREEPVHDRYAMRCHRCAFRQKIAASPLISPLNAVRSPRQALAASTIQIDGPATDIAATSA
jgi:hypothetical protein